MALKFIGERTIGALNGMRDGFVKDDLYRVYDAGILMPGGVSVDHGDFVSWDGTKWKLETDIKIARSDEVSNTNSSIAPNYTKKTYEANSYVMQDGVLYTNPNAIGTAEDWNPAHWTQTTVPEVIDDKIDEVTLDPSAVALGNVHLLDEVTSFAADAKILVDSETNGPGQMPKDTLIGIIDKPIDEKLSWKLDRDVGKNLFNKDTANKKPNVYVTYNAGYVATLSGWSAYAVEIPAGVSQISINMSGAHVCAFSSTPNMPTATGVIAGYLGGTTGATNQGWSLPAGTKCLVVSYPDASIGGLQIESGESSTTFSPYETGLDWSNILNKPAELTKTLLVGSGKEYTTIQSAVNAANDGDTIFIFPGTYDEAVDCQTGGKFIRIVGFSRDSVVITHSGANYNTPPLEIGKGVVENLTIAATGNTIDPDSGVASGAYCVHIDYNQESGSSLQFKNCKFTSELSPCVGVGLRSDFTLSFKGCEFVCTSGQSPVYCHEEQASNKTGQRIELIDCSISNEGNGETDACVLLQETATLSGNVATILMQRCIMKRTYGAFDSTNKAVKLRFYGEGSADGDGYLGSHLWKLDYMSELNNESIANSSEQ